MDGYSIVVVVASKGNQFNNQRDTTNGDVLIHSSLVVEWLCRDAIRDVANESEVQ
jgi:hypothetical protein